MNYLLSVSAKTVSGLFAASLLGGVILSALFVTGCASLKSPEKAQAQAAEPPSTNALSQGYALLGQLTGDEGDVSKLKWIKHESADLKILTDEIAATNRAVHKELETWAKSRFDLKHDGLPWAETAARKAISSYKTHRLLRLKDKELEVELLLSQNEALTYGAHLALILSTSETDQNRAAGLARIYRDLLALQQKVEGRFQARYTPPQTK
jgi:hypothetical protein